MELKQVAERFHDLTFDYYDVAGGNWLPAQTAGRIIPVDRFQSLYSAPLHLRTAALPAGVVLPESRTLRVSGMTQVYLCGQPRDDVAANESRGVLCNLRLVTGEAGGIYQIHRKTTLGATPDKGPLVDSVVAAYYGDSQLFSVKKNDELANDYIGDFHLIFPATADVREWDFAEDASGRMYRILETYFDSGFLLCRALETVDTRVDVTYKLNTVSTYVPGSGNKPTRSDVSYVITGYFKAYVDKDTESSGVSSEFCFCVEADHIGFIPNKQGLISYAGKDHGILSVTHDAVKRQWCFQCRV